MQVTDEMFYAAMDALGSSGSGWLPPSGNVMRQMLQAALDAAGDIDLPVTATVRVQIDEQAFHASVADAVNRLHAGLPRDEDGRITIASLEGAAREVCCVCRSAQVTYHNYKQQPFCGPCADGSPLATDQAPAETNEPRTLVDEAAIADHFQVPPQTAGTWVVYGDGFIPPFPSPATTHGRHGDPLWDLREVKAWHKAWLNGKEPYRMPVTEPRPLIPESHLHLHLGVSNDFIGNAIDQDKRAMATFPWPVRQEPGQERLYDPDAIKAWYDALPQAADG